MRATRATIEKQAEDTLVKIIEVLKCLWHQFGMIGIIIIVAFLASGIGIAPDILVWAGFTTDAAWRTLIATLAYIAPSVMGLGLLMVRLIPHTPPRSGLKAGPENRLAWLLFYTLPVLGLLSLLLEYLQIAPAGDCPTFVWLRHFLRDSAIISGPLDYCLVPLPSDSPLKQVKVLPPIHASVYLVLIGAAAWTGYREWRRHCGTEPPTLVNSIRQHAREIMAFIVGLLFAMWLAHFALVPVQRWISWIEADGAHDPISAALREGPCLPLNEAVPFENGSIQVMLRGILSNDRCNFTIQDISFQRSTGGRVPIPGLDRTLIVDQCSYEAGCARVRIIEQQ